MTEVEIETETTHVESDTVTICDNCGREVNEEGHELHLDPKQTGVSEMVERTLSAAEGVESEQELVGGQDQPIGRAERVKRQIYETQTSLDIKSEATADLCGECWGGMRQELFENSSGDGAMAFQPEQEDSGDRSKLRSFLRRHRPMETVAALWVGMAIGVIAVPDDQTRPLLMAAAVILGVLASGQIVWDPAAEE